MEFLEGLKTAKKLVEEKGIEALDSFIKEQEKQTIETATLDPIMETRGQMPNYLETTTLR